MRVSTILAGDFLNKTGDRTEVILSGQISVRDRQS
jgi:hypothetical protein